MSRVIHQNLAAGDWQKLSLAEQLCNIGSEVSSALNWRNKNAVYQTNALKRGFELLDLTLADQRWHGRQKELAHLREVLVDFFYDKNIYGSSTNNLRQYFDHFAIYARQRYD